MTKGYAATVRIDEIPTPALIVDLPAMERNIGTMAAYFAERTAGLRPHFKAHKTPAIARRQLAAGSCTGLTCATIGEAGVVVREGVSRDVLIATGSVVLPIAFLRFIGVCELLGGLGLILPSVLRIKPGLTPLAAAGLVIIMIGAVSITLAGGGSVGMASFPGVVGLLAGFVAYGRWRLAPLRSRH